jgi:benzoyl-CoA reductase/2-hydroxyglutaryl-CoA dehydratase subunit BcrC/BadD/HgdB
MADEIKKERSTTGAVKTTQTCREAGSLMREFTENAMEAVKAGEPVAWVMVSSLVEELCATMGISPIFTENYATAAASRLGGAEMLETSEGAGYPQGICSYARVGIGHAMLRRELGCVKSEWPLGGMADPTVLLSSSAVCEPRYKWYQQLRRYQNVPYFCGEFSMTRVQSGINPKELEPLVVKTAKAELHRCKEFLVKHTGRKFDEDRFMEVICQTERTKDAWWKCEEIRRAVPGPMPFEDMIGCFPIGFMYSAYPQSEAFFNKMYLELQDRVEKKLEVGNGEKYRILWGWGIPPYGYLKLFNIMEEYGAIPVFGTSNTCYCKYTYDDFDRFTDPFERLIVGYYRNSNHFLEEANRLHVTQDVYDVLRFVKEYKCDGIVMNGTPSCRFRTIGQMAAIEMLKEYSDVPILIMENDMADSRAINEADIRSGIESFVQVVNTAKRKREGN